MSVLRTIGPLVICCVCFCLFLFVCLFLVNISVNSYRGLLWLSVREPDSDERLELFSIPTSTASSVLE